MEQRKKILISVHATRAEQKTSDFGMCHKSRAGDINIGTCHKSREGDINIGTCHKSREGDLRLWNVPQEQKIRHQTSAYSTRAKKKKTDFNSCHKGRGDLPALLSRKDRVRIHLDVLF